MKSHSLKSSISKYDGLKQIERYGLPHPKWIFTRDVQSIPKSPWTQAPNGWTIRCCPKGEYKFGLPSKHRLNYKDLPAQLKALSVVLVEPMFVVYPSWEFVVSGCLLVESGRAFMEVVKGDIAPLLEGRKTPEAVYSCSTPGMSSLTLISGEEGLLSTSDRKTLLNAIRVLSSGSRIVVEWTKTKDSEIFFHDFVQLSECQQR